MTLSMTSFTKLFPEGTAINAEECSKGFSCKKYILRAQGKIYFLRTQSKSSEEFDFELKITQLVAKLDIGPKVFNSTTEPQQILLEHVSCCDLPSFKENPSPYIESMHLLKLFHAHVSTEVEHNSSTTFSPYSGLIERGEKLMERIPGLPRHFPEAIERIRLIFHTLIPWLTKHAVYCHGDFHKDNVLYNGRRVFLIDWETVAWGDPLLDVVKFSVLFDPEERFQLYAEYLEHEPSQQERAHFHLMDVTFLIVVVLNRMCVAYSQPQAELLSKNEMEEMLDRTESLPSFLSLPFSDSSPLARQKGAIYALREFIRRTSKTSEFPRWLEQAQV